MKTEELQRIWGDELFSAFAENINDDGWLTADWAEILESNFSNWDEDYNDTYEKAHLYRLMYAIDIEENCDGTMIRRTDSPWSLLTKEILNSMNDMMKEHEFCIIHKTTTTQLLIDTDFDHSTDEFKIRFKFWSDQVNGYITNELTWAGDSEEDWQGEFEALKDKSYAIGMVNKIFRVMFPGGVFLEDEEEGNHE